MVNEDERGEEREEERKRGKEDGDGSWRNLVVEARSRNERAESVHR